MDSIMISASAVTLLLLLTTLVEIDVVLSQVTIKYDPVETECPEWDAQMMVNQVPWGVPGRAYLTVPRGLRIAQSKTEGIGFGVLSDTFIPKYTWLGEFDGEIVPMEYSGSLSWHAWQVRRSLNIIAYTDGYHLHLSSYHRYFNSPNRHIDANVIFLECYGRIYYMTIKDIAPGDELLIFYGAGYSIEMNLDLNEYYNTSPVLRAAGLDLNNGTHRDWVEDAGYQHYQMRNPPKSFLPFFLRKNTV